MKKTIKKIKKWLDEPLGLVGIFLSAGFIIIVKISILFFLHRTKIVDFLIFMPPEVFRIIQEIVFQLFSNFARTKKQREELRNAWIFLTKLIFPLQTIAVIYLILILLNVIK